MKPGMQYIALFGGLMITSTILVAAVMMWKPELFRSGEEARRTTDAPADTVHNADILRHRRELAGPTPAELTSAADRGPAMKEQTAQKEDFTRLKDSLQLLSEELSNERKKVAALDQQVPPAPVAQATAAPDTLKAKYQKNMAKVLESMPPESAARILQDLSDEEMKAILMNIKKRQAAKILTAIEPSRASKLLRQ